MTEKDVIIDVHSIHGYGRDEEDSLDFTTDGRYRYEGGVCRLSYWESEVTGLTGTRTSVEITPEGVVVDRVGMVTSRMEFKKGGKTCFPYETPYGTATLGVSTRRIEAEFDEHGGRMELDYIMDLEHTMALRNRFQLRVRELPQ